MESASAHPLPPRDPVSGGRLIITELTGEETGITIRGRFEVPRYAQLNPEQAHFLETFLRCRGMLNSVERELGISYPTVRARLDALLRALNLAPAREPEANSGTSFELDPVPSEADPVFEDVADGGESFPSGEFEEPNTDPLAFEAPAEPEPEPAPVPPTVSVAERLEILAQLERGEISPEEAKNRLGVAK